MAVCKKCGTEFEDSLNACPNCGEVLTSDMPEESLDMYQELQASSDTKEFVLLDEFEEPVAAVSRPKHASLVSSATNLTNDELRDQVREMFDEEPEEPTFIDRIKSTLFSFIGSFIKGDKPSVSEESNVVDDSYENSSDTGSVESNEGLVDKEPNAAESDRIVDEAETQVTEEEAQLIENSFKNIIPSVADEFLSPEITGSSLLFDAFSDDYPFEEGFMPIFPVVETEQDEAEGKSAPDESPSEETQETTVESSEEIADAEVIVVPDSDETIISETNELTEVNVLSEEANEEPETVKPDIDSILQDIKERTSAFSIPLFDESADSDETAVNDEVASALEEVFAETTMSSENDVVEAVSKETVPYSDEGPKLLKKKGLGKIGVLSLALLAVLAVLGVIFFWILPQKQAEQDAIKAREDAYLEFLCDTWMSDVFIYTEQEHPSREVLTLNPDLTYKADIWTSSSDREAFDPEIWSITDTNEGTFYLELDTASLRIYYTGDDGEEYVYRRYIRELDKDNLVLREYYNESLSEYYDVHFTKYTEGVNP